VYSSRGPEFAKGHGTENDFVILPDPHGDLKLTETRVRALCDRRRGLGADGVLRVVRSGAIADRPASVHPDLWFMDYRNADGSVAEMCGNGVRVFAKYLVDADLAGVGELLIGTRTGIRPTTVHRDGEVTVDMGPAAIVGKSSTVVAGRLLDGLAIDVGNPHLACVTEVDIEELDLSVVPPHDTGMFPNGVNIEFVRRTGPDLLRMRVHERGVGETRSCGTGTVAATVAALHVDGAESGRRVVQVPGGTVEVEVTAATTRLTGPAVLTARGHLDLGWWQAAE
jgi:diaminopimelate epimerase